MKVIEDYTSLKKMFVRQSSACVTTKGRQVEESVEMQHV